MDFESSPDHSAASAETTTAPSPAESTASAAVSEVSPSTPEVAQSAAPAAETAPEWPEDISSLPGHEQRSNWQQLRGRYQQTHSQVGDLTKQVETFTPIQQKLEQWGGIDQVEQSYALAQSLFAPVIDPTTGQPQRDPATGLPAYSAAPFVERMESESPQTLHEISLRAMDAAYGQETVGHAIVRDYLGLKPELMDVYRQIQSPADAAQFMKNTGQLSAEQLAGIPQKYHEAAKSLTPAMWSEVELMPETTRDEYLAERAEMLEMRGFREQQQAEIMQRQQAEQAAWQRQVEQRGEQYIQTARESALNEVRDKLKAEATFFPEQADNDEVREFIEFKAQQALKNDATLNNASQRCADLYRLAALLESQNEKFFALQRKTEADNLAAKISRAYKSEAAKAVGKWSQRFSQARKGMDAARAEANPRAEFTRNGGQASGVPTHSQQGPRPPGAGRLFISDERKQQIADQLKAQKMVQ